MPAIWYIVCILYICIYVYIPYQMYVRYIYTGMALVFLLSCEDENEKIYIYIYLNIIKSKSLYFKKCILHYVLPINSKTHWYCYLQQTQSQYHSQPRWSAQMQSCQISIVCTSRLAHWHGNGHENKCPHTTQPPA